MFRFPDRFCRSIHLSFGSQHRNKKDICHQTRYNRNQLHSPTGYCEGEGEGEDNEPLKDIKSQSICWFGLLACFLKGEGEQEDEGEAEDQEQEQEGSGRGGGRKTELYTKALVRQIINLLNVVKMDIPELKYSTESFPTQLTLSSSVFIVRSIILSLIQCQANLHSHCVSFPVQKPAEVVAFFSQTRLVEPILVYTVWQLKEHSEP